MLPSYSHLARSRVYGFNRLPLTWPGSAFPFNLTSWTTLPSTISLMTYSPCQCILNFHENLSNLLSYNKTRSFILNLRSLMCRSCHAFSHSFWTCWWNPTINWSSSSSTSCVNLSSKAPRFEIPVNAAMCKLGTMYSIGIIASTPYTSLKWVCLVSFLQVVQ